MMKKMIHIGNVFLHEVNKVSNLAYSAEACVEQQHLFYYLDNSYKWDTNTHGLALYIYRFMYRYTVPLYRWTVFMFTQLYTAVQHYLHTLVLPTLCLDQL